MFVRSVFVKAKKTGTKLGINKRGEKVGSGKYRGRPSYSIVELPIVAVSNVAACTRETFDIEIYVRLNSSRTTSC